jgi:hypothetical protein
MHGRTSFRGVGEGLDREGDVGGVRCAVSLC